MNVIELYKYTVEEINNNIVIGQIGEVRGLEKLINSGLIIRHNVLYINRVFVDNRTDILSYVHHKITNIGFCDVIANFISQSIVDKEEFGYGDIHLATGHDNSFRISVNSHKTVEKKVAVRLCMITSSVEGSNLNLYWNYWMTNNSISWQVKREQEAISDAIEEINK